jgi:hypothetical protein
LAGSDAKPERDDRIQVQFSDQQRFGIVCPRLPMSNDPEMPKRLSRDPRGIQ